MGVTVKGSAAETVIRLKRKSLPTAADALYVGERQRARILRRTESGRDVEGAAFAAYSTRRFYWSPGGRVRSVFHKRLGRLSAGETIRVNEALRKKERASVKRYFKIVTKGESFKAGTAPYVSRSGLSICFPGGYAQFKATLGRRGVDLRGPRAPHMLQAIQVRVEGSGETAAAVRLGIYGEAAKRANAHNAGGGRLPQRRFFGVGKGDKPDAVKDLRDRIRARLKNAGS